MRIPAITSFRTCFLPSIRIPCFRRALPPIKYRQEDDFPWEFPSIRVPCFRRARFLPSNIVGRMISRGNSHRFRSVHRPSAQFPSGARPLFPSHAYPHRDFPGR